jgi:hypothetical protein
MVTDAVLEELLYPYRHQVFHLEAWPESGH